MCFNSICSFSVPILPQSVSRRRACDKTLCDKTLENVATVSCNLYMVLKWMDHKLWSITDDIIRKLMDLKREKGWNPVHPRFVKSLDLCDKSKRLVRRCKDLVSSAGNVFVVSKEGRMDWDLIKSSTLNKFHMKHEEPCDKDWDSKCGFLVGVTGLSRENPDAFDIKLVLAEERYPKDLHFHETYNADKMHIAVEQFMTVFGNVV